MGMLMALTAIAALCLASRVRAGGGLPYTTVTNVTQLIADINYANTSGGTFTIYLQPNTTFTNGQMVIGGTKTVNLTIIGNGDAIDGEHQSRLFGVNPGSSLTLDQITLQNGYVYANYGGAIFNSGMLTISNCTLSGNTSVDRSDYLSSLRGVGGAIYNTGTVIIDNTILSNNLATGANPMGGVIYNASGTVTISNSTFTNNWAVDTVLGIYVDPEYPQSGEGAAIFIESGSVTISHSSLTGNYAALTGGGICNGFPWYSGGSVTVENSSNISGNTVGDVRNSGTLYLDGTSTIGVLDGNSAIPLDGSVGDGIPDWWRLQYFGGTGTSTNAQSCAACDADGTGQNNLFKYTAGLDPTNPASVFVLKIASIVGQPTKKNLIFNPEVSGRTYTTEFTTNLVGTPYATLPGIAGPTTNGTEVTVTDTSAVQPQKFYRISISLP
jgi:hypothetical protein